MSTVNYLLGTEKNQQHLPSLLAIMRTLEAWQPFDSRSMNFVKRFSQKLLTSQGIQAHPELAALGHWFRGSKLRVLSEKYSPDLAEALMFGRGLAFHLAPSNVDSVFMYSWLLSLLAGNVNVVRLSQKTSISQSFLIEVLAQTLAEEVGESIRGRILLITYPHDDEITRMISEASQLRIVWGGDSTVRKIRAIPLRPTATEICFPDRFSVCAIEANALLKIDESQLAQLVGSFYNDAFWFSQQACSSPRLVAWIGEYKTIKSAQARFWPALTKELSRRKPENSEAMNMARVTASFEFASNSLARPYENGGSAPSYPMRLMLEKPLNETAKIIHCGNGLFLELHLPSLVDLASQLTDKEQTLSVFGFTQQELLIFSQKLPARALDRITRIGDALEFELIWDGQDLITAFSRKLLLPTL